MIDNIAHEIKMTIREKGMLQKAVAKRAGFSEQQFSDMLNGRKLILACHVPAIASALGVTPNDLFRGSSQKDVS